MLYHAYVDESGDRGWTPRPANLPPGRRAGSSRMFAMTAVIVPDGVQSTALRSWEIAAQEIHRRPGDVIHWVNVKAPGQRKHLISTIVDIPNVRTVSVALCKFHLPNVNAIRDAGYLYNWTLRLLVERLSWFGESHGAQVGMTFAEVRGLNPKRLHDYVERLHASNNTYIAWDHLKLPARIDTPANRRMLQIADSASGAVFNAFEPDEWGFTEQGYLRILRPAIWRRAHRPMWKEGLKYGPWPSYECSQEHPWFADFCK